MFSTMKKYNVYIEVIYIILAIPLILLAISFLLMSIFNGGYYIYVVLFVLFITLSIGPIFLGLPSTINYLNCKKSKDVIKATLVDKFQKSSKFGFNKDKYIAVIEYKVESMTFRSANVVSKDFIEKIQIKSKVEAKHYNGKALIIQK